MNRFILLSALLSLSSAVHLSVKNGETGKYCLILDSTITGQVQYENTDNKTVTYDFAVNGTAVESSGKCFAVDEKQKSTVETVKVRFSPNDLAPEPLVQDPQWTLFLKFSHPNNTTASFKLVDYYLKAVFYPSFNASLQILTPKILIGQNKCANRQYS